MRYRTRADATAYLTSQHGVPVSNTTLRTHASRGTGPRYSMINGRALYRDEDLDAWVKQQAERPPRRRAIEESQIAAA